MTTIINADNGVVSGSAGLKTSADSTGILELQTNGTTAATVSTGQNFSFVNSVNTPNTFGFKNRIINGNMRIDQRNAGASVTANDGVFATDRFSYAMTQTSKGTSQQSTTAPTGFINSLLFTSSSAYSVLAGDIFAVRQKIEGLNVADLAWGTASAATITLSFWVRSSLTGTFGGSLLNGGGNRSYPFTYTISTANTFEQKTITIAGDTSGTWATTVNTGITLTFGLGVGSTYSGTAGAWGGGSFIQSATGATSVVGTNGATFYITGVQLEKGSTATSFDVRDYGRELMLCQRYFQTLAVSTGSGVYIAPIVADSASTGLGVVFLPVVMRTSPSLAITLSGGTTKYRANMGSINDNSDTNPTIGNTSSTSFRLNYSGFSALTANTSGWVNNRDSTGGYFGVTAEL